MICQESIVVFLLCSSSSSSRSCSGTQGEVWPRISALTPSTHTHTPLSHSVSPSHLSTFSFLYLLSVGHSPPLGFTTKQTVFFLFFTHFLKETFHDSGPYTAWLRLCVCVLTTSEPKNDTQCVKLRKAKLQLSSQFTCCYSCITIRNTRP